MKQFRDIRLRSLERARWAFWTSAAALAEIAARNRKAIYGAMNYAPLAAVAGAAFVLGRVFGLILGSSLF